MFKKYFWNYYVRYINELGLFFDIPIPMKDIKSNNLEQYFKQDTDFIIFKEKKHLGGGSTKIEIYNFNRSQIEEAVDKKK